MNIDLGKTIEETVDRIAAEHQKELQESYQRNSHELTAQTAGLKRQLLEMAESPVAGVIGLDFFVKHRGLIWVSDTIALSYSLTVMNQNHHIFHPLEVGAKPGAYQVAILLIPKEVKPNEGKYFRDKHGNLVEIMNA